MTDPPSLFYDTQVKDTGTLETKRPSVRGPTGALASLGLARGHSLDYEEEGDSWLGNSTGGGGEAGRRDGSGSVFVGGSEAGSRYYGTGGRESGSSVGWEGRAEVSCFLWCFRLG